MFCPQCGANNADTAVVCMQCGRSLQPAAPAPLPIPGVVQPPTQPVQNYLVFAILATVLCCLPAGIVAIIYSAQVNGKAQMGDLAGAKAASDNAKMWCWISFGAGLAAIALWMLVAGAGILRQMGRH
jgi:uncharacterized membrane protein YvbJ